MFRDYQKDSIPDFGKQQENSYDPKQRYKQDNSTDFTDLNHPDSHPQLFQPAETQEGDIFDESKSQEEIQQYQPIQEYSQNSTPSFNFPSQSSLNVNCFSIKNDDGEQCENIQPPQQFQQLKQFSSLHSIEGQTKQQQYQQQQVYHTNLFQQDPEHNTLSSNQLQQQAQQYLQWQNQQQQQQNIEKFIMNQLFPETSPSFDQQPQPLIQTKQPQLNQYSQANNNYSNNSTKEILTSTQIPNEKDQQKQLGQEYSPNNKKQKKSRKQRNQPSINKNKKTLDQAIFMIVLLSYYKDKGNFPGQNFPYTEQEAKNILNSSQFLPQQKISQLLQNLNKFRKSNLKYIKNRDKRSKKLCFREKTILDSLGKNIRIFQYLYNNFQEDEEFIDQNYHNINQYYLHFSRTQNYKNKIELQDCENINIALIQVLQWQIKHDQSKQTLNEKIIQCLQYLEQ